MAWCVWGSTGGLVLWIPECLRTSDMRPGKESGGKVMASKLPKEFAFDYYATVPVSVPTADDWTPGTQAFFEEQ